MRDVRKAGDGKALDAPCEEVVEMEMKSGEVAEV